MNLYNVGDYVYVPISQTDQKAGYARGIVIYAGEHYYRVGYTVMVDYRAKYREGTFYEIELLPILR